MEEELLLLLWLLNGRIYNNNSNNNTSNNNNNISSSSIGRSSIMIIMTIYFWLTQIHFYAQNSTMFKSLPFNHRCPTTTFFLAGGLSHVIFPAGIDCSIIFLDLSDQIHVSSQDCCLCPQWYFCFFELYSEIPEDYCTFKHFKWKPRGGQIQMGSWLTVWKHKWWLQMHQ